MVDHRRVYGDFSCFWIPARKRFRAEATVEYDVQGKRRTIARYATSKSAAVRALRAAIKELEETGPRESKSMTVAEAVREFLELGLPGRSKKTLDDLESSARLHLLPQLGNAKLARLRALDVERWLLGLAATKSTRTVEIAHSVLRRALQRCVVHGLVKRNVAADVATPTGQPGRPSKALPLEVIGPLLTETRGHWFYPQLVILLLTGVRPEEVRALRWEDVHISTKDDEPSYMEVVRSVRCGGDTKTPKSRRALALPRVCVEALKSQADMQARMKEAAGDRWNDSGLVFTTRYGTGMASSNCRRALRSALKLVDGIEPGEWTTKELRHSFVSLLSAHDMSIDEIAQLVGHSGTAVTEAVYRHQLRPVIRFGATKIDGILGDALSVSLTVTPLPGARKKPGEGA